MREYLANNPGIEPAITENLQNLKISLGMTKDEVRLLWGEPNDTVTDDSQGVWFFDRVSLLSFSRVKWFYEVHFTAGRVTDIISWNIGQPL